jgi:hypothetical protein
MKFDILNCLTAKGDGAANDDAVGHAAGRSHVDVWVIDGATSVADEVYVPGADSDPAWFAHTLSREIASASGSAMPVDDILRSAIASTRDRYVAATGGFSAVPVYAWPLAAMVFVRATEEAGRIVFHAHCLGDCLAFVSDGAWKPLWQPQAKGDQPNYLREKLDRAQMKVRIRERRAEQHASPTMGIVVPDPACVANARHVSFAAGRTAGLVLMTDGFARLFQEYALTSAEKVMQELETPDAATGLLERLRTAERPSEAGKRHLIYKNGDDATIIAARLAV